MILSFFTGSAVLVIVMFALGYANLYYRATAVALYGAYALLLLWFLVASDGARRPLGLGPGRAGAVFCRVSYCLLGAACALTLGFVFVYNAAYPLDHDFVTHYGPYLDEVVRRHGIWPNDLWYHYYVTKGSGPVFLGMLLTDKNAPALVSCVYLFVSGLLAFSLVRKFTPNDDRWPLAALVVFLGAYAVSPVDFYKQHVLNGATLLAGLWMTILLPSRPAGAAKGWRLCGLLLCASLVILFPWETTYLLAFQGVYALVFCVRRRWRNVLTLCSWGTIIAATFAGILLLNYRTTGMFDQTPWWLCKRYWDQERFAQWASPYLNVWLDEGSGESVGALAAGTDLLNPKLVLRLIRFEAVDHLFCGADAGPWILLAIIALAILARGGGRRRLLKERLLRCLEFGAVPTLVMTLLAWLSFAAGGHQISTYRATAGFMMFFVAIVPILLWHFAVEAGVVPGKKAIFSSAILIWFAVASVGKYVAAEHEALETRLAFVCGRLALWDAYAQEKRSIAPLLAMREKIGFDRKLVIFDNDSRLGPLFLIGRGLSSPMDHCYGPKWHLMALEDAETAEATFKEEGFHYFLIDVSKPPFDLIAYSQLFSPCTLQARFELVASAPPYFLLTWRGPAEGGSNPAALLPQTIVSYVQQSLAPDSMGKALYERVRYLYALNQGRTSGIERPADLPRLQGWQ